MLQTKVDNAKQNFIIMGDMNGRVGKNNTGLNNHMGRKG